MKIKPANAGAIIRFPGTKTVLPQEGAEVPMDSFWRRRLFFKEVVLVDDTIKETPQDEVQTNPVGKKHKGGY